MSIGISVIIPVYNGESLLEVTLNSLVGQSFENFEVICIDDGSTDGSLDILRTYSEKYDFIKCFEKPNEGTAAKAVNFGLNFVSGKYFMYSSQDDLYSPNLLEINYKKAEELSAEAVVPDTVFYFPGEENNNGIFGLNNNHDVILSGREAFTYSLNWEISGFVLWRKSLLDNMDGKFFDFSINSDEYTTRLLYFHSKKVVFTQEKFYYRQNNPNSITKKWNPRLLESFITIEKLENFARQHSTHSEKDLLRIWEALYHELVRISGIFYQNKKSISKADFFVIEKTLIKHYNTNIHNIRKVLPKSWKQKIIKFIVDRNYKALKSFVILHNWLRK